MAECAARREDKLLEKETDSILKRGCEANENECHGDDDASTISGDSHCEYASGLEYDEDAPQEEDRMRWLECRGSGAFGEVWHVRDEVTKEEYAAKLSQDHEGLAREAAFLERMSGVPGFPAMHFHGMQGEFSLVVMDLLQENLSELQSCCGGKLPLKSVLMIAAQLLDRIEELHSMGLVHRDLKPQNLMMGLGTESSKVHIIDLGLANEYYNFETGCHIPMQKGLGFVGSMEFASVRGHMGVEQSRRDDLESIGYVLISLLIGNLPWSRGSHDCSAEQWYKTCARTKATMPLSQMCKGCPPQFQSYLQYCRRLAFDEDPDYDYLRDLFKLAL